jgi:hypothetical protein
VVNLCSDPFSLLSSVFLVANFRNAAHINREELDRMFVRLTICDAVRSPIIVFAMAIVLSFDESMTHWFEKLWSAWIFLASIFSLLLPPPCYPYLMTLNDPTIGCTGRVTITILTSLMGFLNGFAMMDISRSHQKNLNGSSHRFGSALGLSHSAYSGDFLGTP